MRLRPLAVLLILPFAIVPAAGQEDSSVPAWRAMLDQSVVGLQTSVTSPALRWHWAATALGALAISPWDADFTEPGFRHGTMGQDQARLGDLWGAPIAAVIVLPLVYSMDKLARRDADALPARLQFTLTSLVSVGLVTVIIKELAGRQRPNGSSNRSFPSGHTSIAFGVSEVIRVLYGNWASLPFYLLAINTGLSRIHDNKHYPSDVIAGAGLGLGIVRGFTVAERQKPTTSLVARRTRGDILLTFFIPLSSK